MKSLKERTSEDLKQDIVNYFKGFADFVLMFEHRGLKTTDEIYKQWKNSAGATLEDALDHAIKDLHSRNEELEIFFKENSHQLERQSKLIKELQAKLEDSEFCLEGMTKNYNEEVFEGARLRGKIERFTKALNFYSEESNWKSGIQRLYDGHKYSNSEVELDKGNIAKQALNDEEAIG